MIPKKSSSLLAILLLSFLSSIHGQDTLLIQDISGRRGEVVTTVITLDTTASTHGFSLGVVHDPTQVSLPLNAINPGQILDTAQGGIAPAFWEVGQLATGFTVGCITDFSFPFLTIPPGTNMGLVNVSYQISSEALIGSSLIAFTDTLGEPAVAVVLVQGLVEIVPLTTGGTISVLDPEFLRGDVNGDGQRTIIDGITFLYRLSGLLPPGPCDDADDFNDNGSLDIQDAIGIFQYLFINGSPPPAPFGVCGADPTQDGLNCTSHSPCP